MNTKNIATERAELILQLGEAGLGTGRDLQRLTLVTLRLMALRLDAPGLFNADGTVVRG